MLLSPKSVLSDKLSCKILVNGLEIDPVEDFKFLGMDRSTSYMGISCMNIIR